MVGVRQADSEIKKPRCLAGANFSKGEECGAPSQEIECEGTVSSGRQTRKPYTPSSITCLVITFICSRLHSERTNFSTSLRSTHGIKNDVPG